MPLPELSSIEQIYYMIYLYYFGQIVNIYQQNIQEPVYMSEQQRTAPAPDLELIYRVDKAV